MENKFNLVDEPWIPVVGKGLVSLSDVFSDHSIKALGGNPVQKIALTKLLLAIAQTAYTSKDDDDWKQLSAKGLAKIAYEYLQKKKDLFWLYGDKPFLQMPDIAKAEKQNIGALQYFVATGNTTVLTQYQNEKVLSDAEKSLLVVQMMGFSLGGKKTDNSAVLSHGYNGKKNEKGKPSTGKYGPSIGFLGFLHSFLQGKSLQETIWLNLITKEDISNIKIFSEGIGEVPWEKMPKGEDCPVARKLKNSYIGRLIPLSRFLLLSENEIHYSEGIAHSGYADGMADLSIAVDFSAKKPKVIWVNPEKRPWRELPALLSFFESGNKYECKQLDLGITRAMRFRVQNFGVWAGGLKVSNNAGEQYVSGKDDFVESEMILNTIAISKGFWFPRLKNEMNELDMLSKIAYRSTLSYFKAQNSSSKKTASQASNLFWQLCERHFQDLVNACDAEDKGVEVKELRRVFAGVVNKAYNTYCSKSTARQLDAWSANQPNLTKYLAQ